MKLLTTKLMTVAILLMAAQVLTAKQRVSVHDPSVVYDQTTGRYYVFGSHKAGAFSTDMQNWIVANPTWQPDDNAAAFVTPAVKKVKKGGAEVDFPQFNAYEWSKQSASDYDINGNMWAPDVIWNTSMRKWCMYLSVNGADWLSSIVLLTADNITGPYTYQGPVVISGFRNIHKTDLELAIGQQSSLPERYNVSINWGNRWPNCIDPCVFYDESGKLRMSYGSWSGGIWMLDLDENTGLRDYDVKYPSTGGSTDGVTSDPYFGKKIAGGYYVSGEGSYIRHIGQYYYLFVSYGEFVPDGGYQMRVFRSKNPDGPYVDSRGVSAVYTRRATNYGVDCDTRGEKLMGAYNNWGEMTVGECSQGHNSVIVAPDGRNYLVYHTKFNNGTIGHEVRTHQVFVNQDGWLVAAPFEYNGETVTDQDIATTQSFAADEMAGEYNLLVHQYSLNHKTFEEELPLSITLTADGQVTGSVTGTWSLTDGTGYMSIELDGVTYNGVVFAEQMDGSGLPVISFTACAPSTGANVWGYKRRTVTADWTTDMVAHYGFDDDSLSNTFDESQHAELLKTGNNVKPSLLSGSGRASQYVSLNFGSNENMCYVSMPNPLNGLSLDEGATISFWVKRLDGNAWDALFGFVNGNARLYMTGNSYFGYNGGDGNWIDLNHPNAVVTTNIEIDQWQLVTLSFSRTDIALYVNGSRKPFVTCAGNLNGAGVSAVADYDYGLIVDLLAAADKFYLGSGSFWGTPKALMDDVIVYSRPLNADEVLALYETEQLAYNFAALKPNLVDDWSKGLVAHYGFDDESLGNTLDATQKAELMQTGDNTVPTLESGDGRDSRYVHLNFGGNANTSYVSMPNPFNKLPLNDGATLSFWVKRLDGNAWDALFGFVSGDARVYMTGNTYLGYNGGDDNWIDLNHSTVVTPNNIAVGLWQFVMLSISRTGITLYVNGSRKPFATCAGILNGVDVSTASDFDYNLIVDLLAAADEFYLGRGSFWGTPLSLMDDVMAYSRPLDGDEALALYSQAVQGFDFSSMEPVPGDTNGNGVIDSVDLSTAVTHMLDGSYWESIDMNGDNSIDIIDIVRLIQMITR